MLLRDLGFGPIGATRVYCDNNGAISTSRNPTNKPAMRHVDMRVHLCRQHVELGNIDTQYCDTNAMTADFLSKQTTCSTHERHTARVFGDQASSIPLPPIQTTVAV